MKLTSSLPDRSLQNTQSSSFIDQLLENPGAQAPREASPHTRDSARLLQLCLPDSTWSPRWMNHLRKSQRLTRDDTFQGSVHHTAHQFRHQSRRLMLLNVPANFGRLSSSSKPTAQSIAIG